MGGAHDVIPDFNTGDGVFIEGYANSGSASALPTASTVNAGGLTFALSDGTTITFSNLTDQTVLDGRVRYG